MTETIIKIIGDVSCFCNLPRSTAMIIIIVKHYSELR